MRIFHADELVATHARAARRRTPGVVDEAHWEGPWRARTVEPAEESFRLAVHGRSLEDYAMVAQAEKRGAA